MSSPFSLYDTTENCHNALDEALREESRLRQLLAANENKMQDIFVSLGKHTHKTHKAAQAPPVAFGRNSAFGLPPSGVIAEAAARAAILAKLKARKRQRMDSE